MAQNLALVAAAIFRLSLYVETYSLTELRLATFLWMGLVFTGLVFILFRIVLTRSNRWLLRANVMAALTVLYVSGCLNWPWIVAAYDVAHCSDVTGTGAALDVSYLQSLGQQTVPALDHFQVLTATTEPGPFAQVGEAGQARTALADGPIESNDWRGFSVYDWTLATYLATHQPTHPDAR